MNRHLLRFELRLARFTLICCGAGILLFQCLLVAFYAAARPDETLGGFFNLIPRGIKALFGGEYVNIISVSGFLAFGFTHPLSLLLLCTPIITLASRSASGGAEEGRMDLLLSHPLSRSTVILTRLAAGTVGCVVLVLCMWIGHLIGVILIPLPRRPETLPFVYAALNALLFLVAVQGVAFLAAAPMRLRGSAVGTSIAVLAVMFFLRLASQFWDLFDLPARLSLFTYYVPGKVVFENTLPWRDAGILLGFFTVTAALALRIFNHKDI